MALAAVGGAVAAAVKPVLAHGGAALLGGGAAASEVYDYNRENFLEDREMRMKKEFQERRLRCKQGSLWREDVRDFVSLTERKMKYYLLVNVLLLGFNVNLWCEGRLPENTPGWLMMGNQIATGGSFLFLLLTVWLSMHAAVAAQSYQARVLTQLVRLPIPTWAELEACRTYASEFESMHPRQMFRIPFASGTQEKIAAKLAADNASTQPDVETMAAAEAAAVSAGASSPDLLASGSSEAEAEEAALETCVCGNEFAVDSLFCRRCGQRRAPPTPAKHQVDAHEIAERATAKTLEMNVASRIAADPWGLERRGDDIYELGTHHGKDVAKLRHIKIIRQAAVYWQTYDAFARVSMSVGVNQLMLAMSYYILGYVLCQVRCPPAAFAGVICLIATAEIVARIDLTLPASQQRLIQLLLVFGPGVSCAAAYNWGLEYDLAERIAQGLAPIAFLSHGAVLALMTLFLRVREQQNGAMLPLAFQGVLYLDVFGWIHEDMVQEAADNAVAAAGDGCTTKEIEQAFERTVSCGSELLLDDSFQGLDAPQVQATVGAAARTASRTASAKSKAFPGRRGAGVWGGGDSGSGEQSGSGTSGSDYGTEDHASLGYYAADYVQSDDDECSSDTECESVISMDGANGQEAFSTRRPAVAAVQYDARGRPVPVRPDDLRPPGAEQDMRRLPGAPRMWEVVSAVDAPAKEFFEPVTFMPPGGRRRRKVDELFEDNFPSTPGHHSQKSHHSELPVETGHDNESPGLMPWTIFKTSAALLIAVWVAAAVIALCEAAATRSNNSVWWVVAEEPSETETAVSLLAAHARDVPAPSLLSLWSAGLTGSNVGPQLEEIEVKWPYKSMAPKGLSCDSSGSHLMVTDGLSTFFTKLADVDTKNVALRASKKPATRAHFQETSHCAGLRGEAAIDTALICPNATGSTSHVACKALVLHRHGRRVAVCPLEPQQAGVASLAQVAETVDAEAYAVSRNWLERTHEGSRKHVEEVSWIMADQSCAEQVEQPLHGACASVGTSRGRIAKLQPGFGADGADQASAPMVPIDVIDEREMNTVDAGSFYPQSRKPSLPGVVRAFNSRYVGVWQPHRMSIRVLDLALSGTQAGSIMVPPLAAPWRKTHKTVAHMGQRNQLGLSGRIGGRHRQSQTREDTQRQNEDSPSPSNSFSSFCAGGGHLYFLGGGVSPGLWRMPLPKGLWPDHDHKAAEMVQLDVRAE